MTRYSDDEIMIFAGQVADAVLKSQRREYEYALDKLDGFEDMLDEARNAAADEAERVLRDYDGAATSPLPKNLLMKMASSASYVFAERLYHLIRQKYPSKNFADSLRENVNV